MPRDLVGNNDVLVFVIAHPETMSALVTRTSPSQITITSDGNYQLIEPPDTFRVSSLPLEEYWYELELTDGQTNQRHLLFNGPFVLHPSPRSEI
jgi:hypothetical protein